MKSKIITPIISSRQRYYNIATNDLLSDFVFDKTNELDFKSIAIFAAIGFFIDDTTYFKNIKTLRYATEYTIDNNKIIDRKKIWEWNYSPTIKTFEDSVDIFSNLFESIIEKNTKDKSIILALSGGLDSRTLATALRNRNNVYSYSYEFEDGVPETYYSEQIAKKSKFIFEKYKIPKSYLWSVIDELSDINKCFSEFTHPRQMAIYNKFNNMGDVFLLGHWGDVLFDNSKIKQNISLDEMIVYFYKIILKKGGLELAKNLWSLWGLEGDFEIYLKEQITNLLNEIKIENSNAKIRAFKSIHWATRWTSTNLQIFDSIKPMVLPYYNDEMCKFITTVPEEFLSNRKIQIEYIKRYSSKIAKISWQDHAPYNLYNYERSRTINNYPYRIKNKLIRLFNDKLLNKKYIQRNWENQFLGFQNDNKLKDYIFNNQFNEFIDKKVCEDIYNSFKNKDSVYHSHPLSMLLTLSQFNKKLDLN